MSSFVTEPELLDALARGVRVVLPSSYAARTLRRAYDSGRQAAGSTAWETAPALSWDEWTRSLWSDLIADGKEVRLLLNAAQEHSLWREVLDASTRSRSLASPDSLAELARSGWKLAAEHLGLSRLRSTANSTDSRTFAGWADSFAQILRSQSCLSSAQLDDALREHARSGAFQLESAVLLAGFPALTPSQHALLDALRSSGAQIEQAALTGKTVPDATRAHTVAGSPREEVQLAAHWLRSFLEASSPTGRTPRCAVLVPQPEEERAELESGFREILAPELQPVAADLSSTPWVFAAGAPLLSQPMIADALDLLRWTQGSLPLERASALLRSPFVGSWSDRPAAARFDAYILRRRPLLIPELELSEAHQVLASDARSNASSQPAIPWVQPVAELVAARLRGAPARDFASWAKIFRALLLAANWPGDRPPTALEFATARVWEHTLDLFATLDFRGRRVTPAAALQALERLTQEARVGPVSEAAIEILRPEESEGVVFDAVVVLHATDDAWPETPRLHPLLGWPLQQEQGLPGTDAGRDAEEAIRRAQSLLARTSHVLVTRAREDADGALRPSPLLAHLDLVLRPTDEFLVASADTAIAEELIADTTPLPPLPGSELGGGARALQLQAACGFLAFAELRLGADSPEAHELGLDAGGRGRLVHFALEEFWRNTHSQAELKALTAEERDRRLNRAVDFAFTRIDKATEPWGVAYMALQRERLQLLLRRWLKYELERGPFTVLRQEVDERVAVGPLRLKVRPDRIDKVEDGIVLVDYKTGARAKPSNWLGDRPDDPQLPLYTLPDGRGKLKGLLFAKLRPGKEMGWLGVASDGDVLPSIRARDYLDFDACIAEWREVLTGLATDFVSGRADVRPKSYAVNCKHCEQRMLCRVDPALLNAAEEDEAAEGGSDG